MFNLKKSPSYYFLFFQGLSSYFLAVRLATWLDSHLGVQPQDMKTILKFKTFYNSLTKMREGNFIIIF